MKRLNNSGAATGLVVSFSLTTILLLASLGFGLWAFVGRQDYKTNVDKKIAVAVAAAKQATSTEKDKEYADKEKSQLTSYKGPDAYGRLTINYPKNWSAVISETTDGVLPVNGYFHPNFIPGNAINSTTFSFALRIEVVATPYNVVASTFAGSVATGIIKASPYKAALVPSIVGMKIDGEIFPGRQGSMVIFPLRDKTIQIWTESKSFQTEFNQSVLPSIKFDP